MKKTVALLLFASMICWQSLIAQEIVVIDSLKAVLDQTEVDSTREKTQDELLRLLFRERQVTEALAFGRTLLSKIEDSPNQKREGEVKKLIASGLVYNRQLKEALSWFRDADHIQEQLNDTEVMMITKAGYAQLLLRLNQVKEAVKEANHLRQLASQYDNFKSKIDAYFLIGYAYELQSNYDSALFYQKLIIQEEKEAQKDYQTVLACNAIGSTYYKKGLFDSALVYFQKAYEQVKIQGNKERELIALQNVAVSYYALGQLNDAVAQHLVGVEIAVSLDDKPALGRTYNNIAALFIQMEDFDKAMEYLQKAKAALGGELSYSICNNLGEVYKKGLQNNDSALVYFNKAMKIAEEKSDTFRIVESRISLGDLYYQEGDRAQAKEQWLKVVDITEVINMNSKRILALHGLGNYYLDKKQHQKSLSYYQAAQKIIDKGGGTAFESLDNYKGLHQAYSATGDYQSAYHNLLRMNVEQDTIFNQEKIQAVEDIHTKYQTEKKDLQIQQMADEKRIQELKISQQKQFNILLSVALGIFVLGAIAIGYAFKKLQKTKKVVDHQYDELTKLYVEVNETKEELTASNATKDRFFSMIGHDMKAPLQNLTILLDFLKKNLGTISEKAMISYLTSLKNEFGQILDVHNNLLFWALQQQNGIQYTPIQLDAITLLQENIRLLKSVSEAKKIEIRTHLPKELSLTTDRNMLSFVMRNMLGNAIKYNKMQGSISIELREDNKKLLLSIKDSGIGMDADTLTKIQENQYLALASQKRQQGTGLGLSLSRDFLAKMGGQLIINSRVGEGTKVQVLLPVNQEDMVAIVVD